MAKKKPKNHQPSERWKAYKVTGDKLQRIQKACPKCGEGIFLGVHKDRLYCGRCHYVEMQVTKYFLMIANPISETVERFKEILAIIKLSDPYSWTFNQTSSLENQSGYCAYTTSYGKRLGNFELVLREVNHFKVLPKDPVQFVFPISPVGTGYCLYLMEDGVVKDYFNQDPNTNDLGLREAFSDLEMRVLSRRQRARRNGRRP